MGFLAESDVARLAMNYDELFHHARTIIKRSRDMTHRLMEEEFIPTAPES